jgi:phosphatidylglycerophosphatase A
LLTSCFGLGRLPVAPGTWGSLPPAIVFGLLCQLGASSWVTLVVMAALACAGCVACVKFAPSIIAATGKKDPREVVADEFAGQAITFVVAGFLLRGGVTTGQIWGTAGLGFLLFRVFDIAKLWPIRKLEQLPKGWGVLLDDLLAGLYAGIVLLFCVRVGLISYLSKLLRGWLF